MHCSQDNLIFLKHCTAGPGTRRHAISVSYRPLFRIAAACVHHSNASSSSIAERAVDQPFQSMQHDRSITLSRVLHKSSAISVSSRPGASSVARLLTVAYYLVLSGFKHSVSLVNSIKKCSATIIASVLPGFCITEPLQCHRNSNRLDGQAVQRYYYNSISPFRVL